jgi:hypothetical protein
MKEPKIIYITESGVEDLDRGFITDASIFEGENDAKYISVNHLIDFVNENSEMTNKWSGGVQTRDLLKFIKEE